MRHIALALSIAATVVACSGDKTATYQGYVEGEYVHVASPVGGRLERLLVQRGQTVEAKAPLFSLEAEQETAAKQQADEQLKAAQAQLADLQARQAHARARRGPQAQLAQASAAEEQAALQLTRDEAQFEVGGIARAQLDDSRANHAIKAARVRELVRPARGVAPAGARRADPRAGCPGRGGARGVGQSAWRLDQKRVRGDARPGWWSTRLYREGEWVPAGSPVVRMLPPQNVKVRFFVPQAVAGGTQAGAQRQRCIATAAAPTWPRP